MTFKKNLFMCPSRLYLLEGSLYLHPSCTPIWQVVGWGQFWWGEAKSWRWYRKTSTSARTTRWDTVSTFVYICTCCKLDTDRLLLKITLSGVVFTSNLFCTFHLFPPKSGGRWLFICHLNNRKLDKLTPHNTIPYHKGILQNLLW